MNVSKNIETTGNWFDDLCNIRECIDKESYVLEDLVSSLYKVGNEKLANKIDGVSERLNRLARMLSETTNKKVNDDISLSNESSKNLFVAALAGAKLAGSDIPSGLLNLNSDKFEE